MPAGTVVNYSLWNSSQVITYSAGDTETVYPYKRKYALSDDGLNFKVPDLRNMSIRALRYSDSTSDSERITQGPGGYQNQQIRAHKHGLDLTLGDDNNGNFIDNSNNPSDMGHYITETDDYGGAETRGNNAGMIPQIII